MGFDIIPDEWTEKWYHKLWFYPLAFIYFWVVCPIYELVCWIRSL